MNAIVTPRNQPALPLDLRPERPARVNQTWLNFYGRCKHSAYLYLRYGGGPGSGIMDGGSLVHETLARLTSEALDDGVTKIPSEVAMAALFEVYGEGRFTIPPERWDHIRRCVWNWAEHTELKPDQILGVEQLVVMEVGEWIVSGKLDLCMVDGNKAIVEDYKTQPSPATKEAFEQSLQTKIYSLLLAFGRPVTIQSDGSELVEPYSLTPGAEFFEVAEIYPALPFDDGGLMERRMTMTRADLLNERSMLEAMLVDVSHSFDTGEWPAVPGDGENGRPDSCGRCPARRACPLPDVLLPFPAIESAEEAEHGAMARLLLKHEEKEWTKAAKAWVKNNGPIPLGDGTQLNFVKVEVNETDYAAYSEAQQQGRVVDLEDYRGKRIQTSFKPEPVPEPEPMTPDERWGETMPDGDGTDLSEGQAA